jgi:hypothetical protein
MTDWLREIDDDKNIGWAVLLDFSAAFEIIDHSLLLKKNVWLYTPCYIVDKELFFKRTLYLTRQVS